MTEKYTEERIRELVPEFPAMSSREAWGPITPVEETLLDTRALLAKYRAALERIRDRDWVENVLDPQWAAGVAKTTLEATDE